jgi:phosphatidate cytidylyltransferase
MNETLKRAISGSIYIVLLLVCISFSTLSFFALFGIFLLIAVFEFCNLLGFNKNIPILLATIVYGAICYLSPYNTKLDKNFDLSILVATLLISIKCIALLYDRTNKKVDVMSKYLYLFGYLIFPFVILTKIPFGIRGYNPKIIIGIFILIWTNDTFAYIVGKSVGKHKLFESISPKKTIEGFFGGFVFAILAGYLISKYYIEGSVTNQYIWLVFAVLVSIFGTIGDLVESKFKRLANVKDSGRIMPGHGGVLDRLDSIIFVSPFVFLFYQILNYVTLS